MTIDTTQGRTDVPGLLPNRACRNCSHIKAKCIPQADTPICQRCYRLGKDCTTATSRRRQRTHAAVSSLTPVSVRDHSIPRTEEAHVEAQQSGADLGVDLVTPQNTPQSQSQPTTTSKPYITWCSDPSIKSYTTRSAVHLFHISPEIGHSFVDQKHEDMFDYFQYSMSKHFPFLAFPQGRAPAEIALERPFSYSCCIMTAMHRDPPMQTRIAKDVLRYLSERVLLAGEKSLDLLQGLLVMTAWYHVYSHSQPQLMNLLHFAKALLVDLGLNRPFDASIYSLKMSNDASHQIHGNEITSNMHTTEQRRACLAMYHAHTSFAYAFHRLDPTPWTAYLEDCLKELEEHPEAESDKLMTATVRLDRIHEKYAAETETHMCKTIPTMSFVRLFNQELDIFRGALPEHLRIDSSFLTQLLSVKISLLETAFMHTNGQALQKIEAMHICLQTLNEFFREFSAQPDDDYSKLPFLMWVKVAHALDVLAKLSFSRLEGWDLDYARNSPGFISVVDSLIMKMGALQLHETVHYPDSKDSRFKMFSNRLEKFKQWYQKNLESETVACSDQNPREGPAPVPDASNVHPGPGDFGDLLWQDFMTFPALEYEFNFSV